MACQGCINRHRKFLALVCKKPESLLCRKAQERLVKMLARQEGDTRERDSGPPPTTD